MVERRSDREYSDEEMALELSLHGEGMEVLESQEQFLCARQALCDLVAAILSGEGESGEANRRYAEQLLVEVSKGFARTVQLSDESEQREVANLLMAQSTSELSVVASASSTPITGVDYGAEAAAEILDEILSDDDTEEQAVALEECFGVHYTQLIDMFYVYAPENKNDVRQQRHERVMVLTRRVLGEVSKVALGATLAVVATRLLSKK